MYLCPGQTVCYKDRKTRRPAVIKPKQRSLGEFIASTRLALLLLVLIALCSILGTIIPQEHSAREIFAGNHPVLSTLLNRLGFFNLFHSPLFLLLEAGLTLNLIACTWKRFPAWLRRYRGRIAPGKPVAGANLDKPIFLPGDIEENADRIEKCLRVPYGKPLRRASEKTVWIEWRKNALSALGVPVVHSGVLLIVIGALLGSLFGFEGRAVINEGAAVQTVFLKGGGTKELGFTVRCIRFTVQYYENGAPREFKSDLEFSRNGRVLARGAVKVNEPLEIEGIRFYQESYGTVPDAVILSVAQDAGKGREIRIGSGEETKIPGTETSIRIIRAEDDLMGFGPGVKIWVGSDGRQDTFWVFKNIEQLKAANPGLLEKVPLFNPDRFKPYRFVLKQIGTRNYTGLQVNRDPGVPVIFAGFITVILGCVLIYIFPYKKIGIALEREGKGVRVGIACKMEKHEAGQKREAEKIRKMIEQKGK